VRVAARHGAATVRAMTETVKQVAVSEPALDRVLRIIRATHPSAEEAPPVVRKYVQYGASPRAAQAMILAGKALALLDGRYHVAAEDVARVALPALNHRIIRNFHGEMEQVSTAAIVEGIVAAAGGRA